MEEGGEEETVGGSWGNRTERSGNKRLKLLEKEDRISDLPDSLIHHILSFLPSTKQAIQTGILSKRWQNQWTRVPVLIFESTSKSDKNFSQFIDRTLTLHDCLKIKKFHIQFDCNLRCDPHLTSKIRFATRKDVEELILNLCPLDEFRLPKFLFNNASLVKLELFKCSIGYNVRVSWPSLKELKLECSQVHNLAIENVVSGCPLLELLELSGIFGFFDVVIASKSLKRLIFVDVETEDDSDDDSEKIEISCPNLEQLSITISVDSRIGFSNLQDQAIENVLSNSPLLHTLELLHYSCSDRLVIASKSLKKLVLGELNLVNFKLSEFKISCPDLEEFEIGTLEFETIENFDSQSFAIKILGQLQVVKMLKIGSWFIKILSDLEVEDLPSPLLNCKCLTLDGTNFDEHLRGIVCAIRCASVLEKLVIKLDERRKPNDLLDLNDCRKNYWNLNGTVFNCSVSNLKTLKIIGLSERDEKHKLVFNFVEFLLKNARVLEKIIVILADYGTSFLFEVSTKLLSFQRCFPHTTIELLRST
ncbi:putative F-box/LRR-repeat protein At3g18150 isoform X1 [Euphorbia lathyris]|uniref:putative F-box/LRR-repeat protein At3g18150 isoform X1 n=1 Tax=Euphorbia lathyris TaxID=212925 RepID=UPI0033141A2A